MPNTIRHKRGTVAPTAGVLQTGEIAINTTNGFAYTKTDVGSVVQIGSTTDLSGYAALNSTQTFAQPQVISSPSGATLPALRITNDASATTAHSLVVEDAANPDTTSFIVNNIGSVGIGVSPATWNGTTSRKLDVIGNVFVTGQQTVTGNISITHSGSAAGLQIAQTGTGHALLIEDTASPDATSFIVNGDGNIGVGVHQSTFTATAKFGIYNSSALPSAIISQTGTGGGLNVTNTGTGTALTVTNTGTNNSLVVEDVTSPDSDAFVINASGTVGIGVSTGWTPQEKLDVNGYISCTTPPIAPFVSSSRVATAGYVRSAVIPEIIDGATYSPSSTITKWNSLVRIDDTATFSLQLPVEGVGMELPIGTQIVFLQVNTGQIDFTPTNVNVVMSAGGRYLTKEQYSVATAIKTGVDEWLIAGDLVVS